MESQIGEIALSAGRELMSPATVGASLVVTLSLATGTAARLLDRIHDLTTSRRCS